MSAIRGRDVCRPSYRYMLDKNISERRDMTGKGHERREDFRKKHRLKCVSVWSTTKRQRQQ